MSKAPISDSELWSAVRNDDRLAFNMLFDRYWGKLHKLACNYLKDGEAREEVVHDVFLNIWTRRNELEIHSFPSFLLTATRYHIYNRLRAAKLSVVYTSDYTNTDRVFELNLGDDRIQHQELQNELNQHLNQLPKRCHEIFQMSRMQHLSNDEIANNLGVSKRTVENQLALAVKHLKSCYKSFSTITLLFFLFK